MFITLRPMPDMELVNLYGTSLEGTELSDTLNTTVSHSLPCDPCTVITQSWYLRGTLDLRSRHCAEYGDRIQTEAGSGDSALSRSLTAVASAGFSLPSRTAHVASITSIEMSLPSSPVSPLR